MSAPTYRPITTIAEFRAALDEGLAIETQIKADWPWVESCFSGFTSERFNPSNQGEFFRAIQYRAVVPAVQP